MIKVSVTWHLGPGQSPEESDRQYFEVHVPMVRRLPNLRRHVVLRAIEWPEGAAPACWRGDDIFFDSEEAFEAATASAEWAAVRSDGFGPAVAGLQVQVFDVEEEFIPEGVPAPGRAPAGSTVTCLRGTWHVPAGHPPEAIDRHYYNVHVPNVRRLPHLSRHVVLKTIGWPTGSHPPSWRGAETWATTRDQFDTQVGSQEWAAHEVDGWLGMVAGVHVDVFDVEEEWVLDD